MLWQGCTLRMEIIMDLTREWYRNEFVNLEVMESHRILEKELPFYFAVAEGNLEEVEANIASGAFTRMEGMGRLSNNPVTNIKYHFVVSTALITRYCIQNGMEQEKAYGLSDFYILKMDELTTIEDIGALHDSMCLDWCRQMIKIRSSHVLSRPVIQCINYIYSHLHSRITVHELSTQIGLSDSYLSKLFSREMGIPVSTYITQLKIDKAKNLLQYSEYSIVDIANYLAFSSLSHFIQTFKKLTGITPHKFRMQNFKSDWDKLNDI